MALGRAMRLRDEANRMNGVAIEPVALLETPLNGARATGFVAAGETAMVELTGAPGWVYVTAKNGEGYALEESFAITRRDPEAA